MGWQIEHLGSPKIKDRVIDIFRQLSLGDIISNVLDAVFFGFSVGQIIWKMEGNEIVPVDIVGKPQEWFIFTKENELRLRKYVNSSYIFEEGEKFPEYKFILTQYQPTYINPYGEKVLSGIYWPVTFKRSGIEFWQLMMEGNGMPYLIGKYPNSFTQKQKDE